MTSNIPKSYYHEIGTSLLESERLHVLEEADLRRREDGVGGAPLSESDIEVLYELSRDYDALIRKLAITILSREASSLTWDDIEGWLLDPDTKVRESAFVAALAEPVTARLCESDKQRFLNIVLKGAQLYDDGIFAMILRHLSEKNEEWRDLTWETANQLINVGEPFVFASLVTGYFEHVISGNNWGPDDVHLRPWIEGTDTVRKGILLDVGAYLHLIGGKLREIVEALSHDPDEKIAQDAKVILDYCK